MAERYTKLYTLPGNLYAAGSPVLISAGALLKDSQTGKVLCQLKFKNISAKQISALKVLVIGYDMSAEEVCRAEHQYLDLKVDRRSSFGSKEAIPLPDNSVRSYTAQVISVHFADGSRYAANEQDWAPLPEAEHLRDRLFDRELIRQYRLESSDKSEYVPLRHKDIWLCSCGEINPQDEVCFNCAQSFGNLSCLLNVDLLLEHKNERLLEESRQAAVKESNREHSFKIVKILLAVLIPLLLAAGVFFYMQNRAVKREAVYENANILYSSGQYSEAASIFDSLGDYKDSLAMAEEARAIMSELNNYEKAQKFLENGRFDDAYEVFTHMGDYENAPELAKEALYRKALSLAGKAECEEAIELFLSIADYKDAAKQAECFVYLLVSEESSYNTECEGPLTTSYAYDDAGQLSVKTEHFSAYPELQDRVTNYSYNDDGSYTETIHNTVRTYDANGNLTAENGVSSFVYEYGYHDNGALHFVGVYSAEDNGFLYENVYDEQGNLIRYSTADGSTYTTTNEYDDSGLLIKQENFNADGAFIDRTGFEYDDAGRLKRSTYMDLNNTVSITNFSYELKYLPGLANVG